MAGPYISMKLGSGVMFDGRAAWGETANAVASPDIDDSLTARRLVRGKFTGTREVQGWNVAPSVGLVYLEDAVRDSALPAKRAPPAPARSRCCPRSRSASPLDDVTFIEPRAAVGAFVGFDDLQALNPSRTVGAADRCAVEGRSGRRVRRQGRLELAGDGRRRKRDDVNGDAELDGTSAAQRSARTNDARFAAQQTILSTSVLPLCNGMLFRVSHMSRIVRRCR